MFFLRDPLKFGNLIGWQKLRADSNLRDHDMQDFWTLSPETAHQVTWLIGDRGIAQLAAHEPLWRPYVYVGQRRRPAASARAAAPGPVGVAAC